MKLKEVCISYQSIAQRNAIIPARMELGMLVSVTAENKIYKPIVLHL
jgi:hypothetical protein